MTRQRPLEVRDRPRRKTMTCDPAWPWQQRRQSDNVQASARPAVRYRARSQLSEPGSCSSFPQTRSGHLAARHYVISDTVWAILVAHFEAATGEGRRLGKSGAVRIL